jgi:hypothetical protein
MPWMIAGIRFILPICPSPSSSDEIIVANWVRR